jgi:predicted RNA binding protein YcfA (HicA-like mRNA interferase family)
MRVGLVPVRQSGSHIRLTGTLRGVEVHVTVPRHRALRVGTLSGILGEVADHLGIDRDALITQLFG